MSQIEISFSTPRKKSALLSAQKTWERFSYYGVRALLVLYLIRPMSYPGNPGRGWSESDANLLFGWYAGLIFLLPVIGGYVTGKVLGERRSVLLGGITLTLALALLASCEIEPMASSPYESGAFAAALVLLALGTGFFRPSSAAEQDQLVTRATLAPGSTEPGAPPPQVASRVASAPGVASTHRGLTSLSINVGVFACVLLCGTLGEAVRWPWGFAALAVTMLMGFITYAAGARGTEPDAGRGRWGLAIVLFAFSLAIAATIGWLYQTRNLGWITAYILALWQNDAFRTSVPASVGPLLLGLIIWYIAIQEKGYRAATAAVLILIIFYGLFWLAFHQMGSTLNEFAQRSVNREIRDWDVPFINRRITLWEIPVTWFQALNVLLIVLFAPLFARFAHSSSGHGRPEATTIGIALLVLGLGFGVLTFAASQTAEDTKVALPWFLVAFAVITLAELILVPAGFAFIQRIIPDRPTQILVSVSFVVLFVSNLAGGVIASYAESIERGEIRLPWYRWFRAFDDSGSALPGRGWADFFFLFVVISLGAGIVALLYAPLHKRLVRLSHAS
jgi:POT family proton-dependent oligopeptide transporter